MKTQKGFIQIPLLIAIVAGVLVLSGSGYFGVKQYKGYQVEKQTEKTEQERIVLEREKKAQVVLEAQQKSLEQAQVEIEKLKKKSTDEQKKRNALEQKVASQDISISTKIIRTGTGRN